MRYWFVVVFIVVGISSYAQSDIRQEWRNAKKIKVDAMGFAAQFPAVLVGLEYPLKDNANALEHELGIIFSAGSQNQALKTSNGIRTSHTFLLYGDRRDYVIGIGAHYRQLNISGDFTVCAESNPNGGCAYFRLFDEEPIRTQRIAPYLRLRRMTYLRNNVTMSFGVDLGRSFQKVTNDIFEEENLSLENRIFGLNLDQSSEVYFRLQMHFIVKI